MANTINVIYPYRDCGMWVFDDEKTELEKEPFVAGADTMIDKVLAMKGLTNPEAGFRLIFSAGEFPQYDVRLDWYRKVLLAMGNGFILIGIQKSITYVIINDSEGNYTK